MEIMEDRGWVDAMDHRGADLFFNALAQSGDLAGRKALDAFARDGILTVARYFDKVKALDLWELNQEFAPALRQIPGAVVTIDDSYRTVALCPGKFDFIVVDTPQGVYNTVNGAVAEHFDFLRLMPRIMADDCLVVVYVNKDPYVRNDTGNYGRDSYDEHDHDNWMARRVRFYGTSKITEGQALNSYAHEFRSLGFGITKTLLTPCWDSHPGLPPSFRLAMWLRRA